MAVMWAVSEAISLVVQSAQNYVKKIEEEKAATIELNTTTKK